MILSSGRAASASLLRRAAVSGARGCGPPAGAAAASSTQAEKLQQRLRVGQVRYHHPDPFNPKVTKGWKAALKVRTRGYAVGEC